MVRLEQHSECVGEALDSGSFSWPLPLWRFYWGLSVTVLPPSLLTI